MKGKNLFYLLNKCFCTSQCSKRNIYLIFTSVSYSGVSSTVQVMKDEAEITTIDDNTHADYMVVHGSNINQGRIYF